MCGPSKITAGSGPVYGVTPCTAPWRTAWWLSLAGCCAILAVGCRSERTVEENSASASLNGIAVRVAAPSELSLAERWSARIDEWQAATGAVCEIDEVDYGRETDSTPTLPRNADLAIVPLRWIPDLLDGDVLAPLPQHEPAWPLSAWEDVLRGLRTGVAQPGGRAMLIPLSCPVLACYYRADLLESAGRKPPETWQHYQALLEGLPEWGGGLPAVEPWSDAFRAAMFLARAAPYALHPDNLSFTLDIQTGTPLLAEPPFVQALEDALAALRHLDAASLTMGPEQCVQAVLEGRAAMAVGVVGNLETSGERQPAGSAEGFRLGVVRLPGAARVFHRQRGSWVAPTDGEAARVVVVGFGGYAVCAAQQTDETTRRAAWHLWASLHSDDAEQDASSELWFGPAVCRAADLAAALRSPAPGIDSEGWRRHVDATTGALQSARVVLDLPLPQPQQFQQRLAARLSTALDGTSAAETALQDAAADWSALIETLGRARVTDIYRQCHGLTPLSPR